MKHIKPFLLSCLTIAILASCNTQNPILPEINEPGTDEPEVGTPRITDFGVIASDTTIKIGADIRFNPKVSTSTKSDNTYQYKWVVGGKIVATTADYKFTATAGGVSELTYTVSNSAGSASRSLQITAKAFVGGFMIVNEGWFGHESGSIHRYDPAADSIETQIFKKSNTDKTLGTTTCHASQWADRYYFVSKQGRRLVVADRYSFVETGALRTLATVSGRAADGRAFAGVNASTGILTTSQGAFMLNLNPLTIGDIIQGTSGDQCGAIYTTEKYVFVINQNKGLQIFDIKNNYNLLHQIKGVSVGFAKTKDGSLWAAATDSLLSVNIETLAIKNVKLPSGVQINSSWGAWNSGPLVASPNENALYFTKSGAWGGGREVYCYKTDNLGSLSSVFLTSTDATDNFYGSGIGVDPESGDIVATFVHDGWADFDDNRLVIFDSKTGAEKKRIKYDGYWFPAMLLFN